MPAFHAVAVERRCRLASSRRFFREQSRRRGRTGGSYLLAILQIIAMIAQNMKALLILLAMLTLPVLGGVNWSHRVAEGQDGGINANYFLYETFRPDYGDGTLMSVQRVRAIYAFEREGEILVVDYFLHAGIRVVEMRAARESLADLIAGKDVKFKPTGEFSVDAETSVGYLRPKNVKALTDEQRERIFNLVYILSMQRSPIKAKQGGADQPATAPE